MPLCKCFYGYMRAFTGNRECLHEERQMNILHNRKYEVLY